MKSTKLKTATRDGLAAEVRTLRRNLQMLTTAVDVAIAELDDLMLQPPTVDRGRAVAQIFNGLELKNDMAWRFGLGVIDRKKRERSIR